MTYPFEDEGLDVHRMPGTRSYTSHTPGRPDPTVHTLAHPFCYDPECTCHSNEAKLQAVEEWVDDGLMTEEEAAAYIAGQTL